MNAAIIRARDCIPQRWKNDLGTTREVAREPDAARGDDFDWRVSLADVDSASPFSTFRGIDRHIVLLDGAGFTMVLDDGRVHPLTTPYAPFAFPGEAQVEVRLAGGPTRDFNLMVRRRHGRGTIAVLRDAGTYRPASATVLVYAARGAIDTEDGRLQPGDAWRPRSPCRSSISLCAGAVALLAGVELID